MSSRHQRWLFSERNDFHYWEEALRSSDWALAAADRIDALRNAHFVEVFEIDDDAN